MPPFETISVDKPVVACDGGVEGHPRVFLNLGASGQVECPYCSRLFVLRKEGQSGSGAATPHP